jgi:hypothetical protein
VAGEDASASAEARTGSDPHTTGETQPASDAALLEAREDEALLEAGENAAATHAAETDNGAEADHALEDDEEGEEGEEGDELSAEGGDSHELVAAPRNPSD